MFGKGSFRKSHSRIKLGLVLVLALSFSASAWAGEPEGEQAPTPPVLNRIYQPLMLRAMQYVESTGVLDPSFGGDGRVNTNLGFSDDGGYAAALQTDGKLVVAGSMSGAGPGKGIAVVRYNPSGTLDTSFSGDGIVVTYIGNEWIDDDAQAVAVQTDGKIVVAGYTNENDAVAMVRYNPDGSLDTSFNDDGIVVTDFTGGWDVVDDVALQVDGKIIVAGFSYVGDTSDFLVARYNPNGSLDSSFDEDGWVLTDFYGQVDLGRSVTLQADGKIVVAGYSVGTTVDFALARYNPNGSPDTSFDGDGLVLTDFANGGDRGAAVTYQTDGKLVVAGYASNGVDYDFGVARYNENGTLDTTFGTGGKVMTNFLSRNDAATAILLLPDGRIVAAGYVSNGLNHDFGVARYNTDGSLDDSFDVDGKVVTDIAGATDVSWSAMLDPDEKIIVAGYSFGSSYDIAIARYTSNGSLDTSFSGDGIVLTNLAGSRDEGTAVVRQPDGKIVVAGHSAGNFALARYYPYGSLDLNFSGDGWVTTDFAGRGEEAYDVKLQPDGKIVVAGYTNTSANDDFALARYKPDGSLDTTFDGDGLVITDLAGGHDRGYGVALQSDGKIVVVGVAYNGTNDDFAVVRYRPDGSLDPDFGSLGKVLTDFAGGGDEAQDVVLQTDGKIVVVGSASGDIALARYNPNGSLDGSFSTDGKVMSDFSSSDGAKAVVLQPDGKIVVAGTVWGGADDFAIARYYPNGILDSNFSGDGLAVLSLKGGPEVLYDVVLQANGKIIAAGGSITNYVPDLIIDYDFTILRYHPDGSLDTSFDGDGIVYTSFGVGIDGASGVLLLPDGKILAVGFMDNGMDRDFALARYK